MADYQLTAGTSIIRNADSACIPANPDNRDYAEYLDWIALGNVPDPHVAPPPSPAQDASARLDSGQADTR